MRRKRFAVKLFVYLAFVAWLGGIVFLIGYRARNPIDAYSNPQSQEWPTQKPVTSFHQYDTEPSGKQSDDDQTYASKVFEPMTLLTLFLVFGVGITAYIYWRQLKKMEETVALVGKQGKTMEGQLTEMKEQTNIAGIMAKAAQLSANVAQDALRIAERPYLDVSAFNVKPMPFEVGKPITYAAKVENTGRTPAYDVWGGIYLTISESEITDETGLDYPEFSHPPSKAPISSGRHNTRRRTTPDLRLTQFDVERLDDGRLFLYVYGVEFYKDGFTVDIHRLAYCHQYNHLTKRMEISAFHNDSD